jgi:hypothetical protein
MKPQNTPKHLNRDFKGSPPSKSMNFVSHFLPLPYGPSLWHMEWQPKTYWKPTTPQLRHQKLCTIQLSDCLSNNFRRLPKETAPRFGTWNESPKHTQKLTTPQSIYRKRCTIQLEEIDLRQFSSAFLPNYPLVFGTWDESPKHTWKTTTLQSRCQNRCQIQLHEFLSNLKKVPPNLPKEARVCLPIDYSFLKLVPEASSATFTIWWWLL